jgi:hypothetical protein
MFLPTLFKFKSPFSTTPMLLPLHQHTSKRKKESICIGRESNPGLAEFI